MGFPSELGHLIGRSLAGMGNAYRLGSQPAFRHCGQCLMNCLLCHLRAFVS